MQLAFIPSPSQSVWHLGPLPIRAYALCIVAGIIVALWLGARRMRERGGAPEDVWDVAGWAIVFGIIGGRLYHVVTDPELYFEKGRHPIDAFKIWDGGLGIWGAIALGTLGAWIGCRRKGISLLVFADAVCPGVLLAQAIGRWGNWFNNELYGGPTSKPWGLEIHCLDVTVGHAVAGSTASGGERCADGATTLAQHYQPTFLYESLWSIAVVALILYLDRRFRVGHGNVMALYVMGYTLGRVWIEALRTDTANHILGLRLNIWTSIIVFALAAAWFVKHGGLRSGREETPYTRPRATEDDDEVGDAPVATGTLLLWAPRSASPTAVNGTMTDQTTERPEVEAHHSHRDVTGGWLRPTVFGMMDGLVSNLALIAGVAGASATSSQVSLAGLAGLVGGAFSMATGEYISVQSQNESTHAEVEVERRELARNPADELAELAASYEARGVEPGLALEVARQLSRDPVQALAIHTQEELGLDTTALPSPWTAAASSLVAFSIGALLPLLPYLLGATSLTISAIVAIAALFTAGAISSKFTGRSWVFAGGRQLLLGVAAAAVTFGIGALFHTSVG